jgi:hypothetical protein
MVRRVLAIGLLGLGVLGSSWARAEQKQPWIHVQVNQEGADGAKVNVNLPLSLIEVALEVAKDEALAGGEIEINHTDVSVEDMRRMWNELKQAGDSDLVTAEQRDELVQVSQRDQRVLVQVTDKTTGKTKVHVEVPAAVVDSLLSGTGERLNLKGALAQLGSQSRGEFIRIDDGDNHVRVWID